MHDKCYIYAKLDGSKKAKYKFTNAVADFHITTNISQRSAVTSKSYKSLINTNQNNVLH